MAKRKTQQEEVQVMEFITSWERRARTESRREILIRLLRVKFDDVPETTMQRVESISSTDELDQLLEKVIHANSLAEMGLDGMKA